MGLQVRLRHALGERLVDLADRPVERPLIVGRSREADVKIPSVAVAGEHCALFVHDGQWVLQDTSGGNTWINGNPIDGATALSIGDVIVVGTDATPATIEIDPAGVAQGRSGHPAQSLAPAPAPQRAAAAPRAQAARSAATTAAAPSAPSARPPQVRAPVQAEDPWGNQTPQDDPFAAWGQPAAAASAEAAPVRRRKPTKQSSEGPLIFGIAICLVIVGTTGYMVYRHFNPPPPQVVVQPPQKWAAPKSNNIFGIGGGDGDASSLPNAPAPVISPSTVAPARAPKVEVGPSTPIPTPPSADAPTPSSSANSSPPADSGPIKDETWREIEGASMTLLPNKAILKYDDYRKEHAGAFSKELDAMTDAAMDRLWWDRIAQLCGRRDSTNKKIKAKDKEIKEEPNPKFRQTLMDEKKPLLTDLAQIQERLESELGYTGDSPNQDDKEMMAKLSSERDASKFGAWKVRTLKFIRSSHGATPWDGEN